MNVYRLYPTLWNDGTIARTIYAIDRAPQLLLTKCSSYVKEDPLRDGFTFQRICTPTLDYITYHTLPEWISYAQQSGYFIDLTKTIKPYSDIYITGS